MSPEPLSLVRWVLLAIAVLVLLSSTILYDRIMAPPIRRLAAAYEQRGNPLPAFVFAEWFVRAWNVLNGLVLLALWWYLGTPGGVAMWANLTSGGG
jgi:hypothetical protein